MSETYKLQGSYSSLRNTRHYDPGPPVTRTNRRRRKSRREGFCLLLLCLLQMIGLVSPQERALATDSYSAQCETSVTMGTGENSTQNSATKPAMLDVLNMWWRTSSNNYKASRIWGNFKG